MTLDIITADSIAPLRHGFFGRSGGASSGIFSGLNCGFGSTDQHEVVAINRARVAEALAVDPSHLVGVHQVHSADVIMIKEPTSARAQADAMVTDIPGIALSVLTADCQPVLFTDHNAQVIGAAHAGWKGALHGILEATLDAMEHLGADRQNIHAIIGPCISQRAYEVGQAFFDDFVQEDESYARFFAGGKEGHMQFDLPSFSLGRLRSAGIGSAEWTHHCTYSDPERFYSYRRATHAKEADYGRLIAAICL